MCLYLTLQYKIIFVFLTHTPWLVPFGKDQPSLLNIALQSTNIASSMKTWKEVAPDSTSQYGSTSQFLKCNPRTTWIYLHINYCNKWDLQYSVWNSFQVWSRPPQYLARDPGRDASAKTRRATKRRDAPWHVFGVVPRYTHSQDIM